MDNLLALQRLAARQDDTDRKYWKELKYARAHTIGVDSTTSSAVSGRPGYAWVREYGMNGGVFQVLNGVVSDQIDLPVIIGSEPNRPYKRRIICLDVDTLVMMEGYTGQPFLPTHHTTHEWPDYFPGSDVVTMFPRAYSQLRVSPGVGLSVNVSAYRYYDSNGDYIEWPGQLNYSISSQQPAVGLARNVLIYYDPVNQQLGIVAGSTSTDVDTIRPTAPTLPTSMLATALVRIDGSQTQIAESDILDVRQLLDNAEVYTTPAIVTTVTLEHLALLEAEFDFALTTHVVMG